MADPSNPTPLQLHQTWQVEGTYRNQSVGKSVVLRPFPHANGYDPLSNLTEADYQKILTTELWRYSHRIDGPEYTSLPGYAGYDVNAKAVRFVWAQPSPMTTTMTERFECRVTRFASGDTRMAGTLRVYSMPYRPPEASLPPYVPQWPRSGPDDSAAWVGGKWREPGTWTDVGACTATLKF